MKKVTHFCIAILGLILFTPTGDGQSPDWRLLFSGPDDIVQPWGKLTFTASPLQKLGESNAPGMAICCQPRPDGAYDVYAVQFTDDKMHSRYEWQNSWKLVRAVTRDGLQYGEAETVFESPVAPWTENFAMAYNPDAKEFVLLNLKVVSEGFQYTAFFSPDGKQWKAYEKNPLFYEGDAMSLFWSPVAHRLVCISKSLQPYPKHFLDHGGTTPNLHNDALHDRRVLAIRSSKDGRHWEPDVSYADIWNHENRKAPIPDRYLLLPDQEDPPDLEFYSGNGFWYYDRTYMLAFNYAPSPIMPKTHGPHLDFEWWLSRDGLRWSRPYRDVSAEPFTRFDRPSSNPMVLNGMVLFPLGKKVVGLKQDRISGVGARANGEFSTRPFTMPPMGVCLNAACPSHERAYAGEQAYIMADVLDENGQVIPGFEAEKSLLRKGDATDLPLVWDKESAGKLAGRKVSLRFHLRSADIYAVTAAEPRP